jgi:NitT/TauT family transport system permease protein
MERAAARWERFVWPSLVMAATLLLWSLSVRWTGTKVFPAPREVGLGIAELLHKHVLWDDIVDSLRRVVIGFGLASLVGIPFGLFLGWRPAANRLVNPVLQILRPISPLAWIPVAILLLGVGDRAAIFLIFLGALFPTIVASIDGVATVPLVFRRAGSNFGFSEAEVLRRVIFPAALPKILVGIRIAFGIAWLVVVAAEMVAVDSGLGYLVIDSRNSGKRYDLVVAAMLIIGAIGLALDSLLRAIEKIRAVRWGFRHEF